MKATYEQLEHALGVAQAQITKLQGLLKTALGQIAKLEEKLGRNSDNSSNPPSSDQKGNTPGKKNKERTWGGNHDPSIHSIASTNT